MTTALEIARALVRCASITPADEGALDYLRDLLQAAGFSTHRLRFSEPGSADVENLYARIGADAPCLVFAGHTDVVPPGDASRWRFDPFSAEVAEQMLWGRGAVDMKGGLAACVAAALAFVAEREPRRGSIAFLITGDEEGPGVNGTKKLLAWARARGERFDHCLLAEPTSRDALGDTMKIGRRGSLSGALEVHGKQGHVGYPQLADNPIHHLLRLTGALLASPFDSGTPHFERSNLEITSIDVGNRAVNVIPAEARAVFNVRFNDLWTPETLAAELESRVAARAEGARYTLTFEPSNAVAFLTKPGPFVDLVSAAVEQVTGRVPDLSTSGGTSDARFIKDDCPVVEFGLVGKTMHGVDERAPVADLEILAAVCRQVLRAYFG
ncbi:MAG TPA: succinyl-diaminopimelate desuccinylase [Beijerinckiaceae bacterium]|nr:succinyl-diaminopimelate desuccinylase [Beijerinckiaceae bacterium]